MRNQDELLQAIRSRGSDARDIRDAAHEATHAMQSRIRGPWERERLHAALERTALRGNSSRDFMNLMVRYELQARAVEMLTCERYGIAYEPEQWAMWCAMETAKTYRVDIGRIDDVVDAIRIVADQRETVALLNRVLAVRPRREAVP